MSCTEWEQWKRWAASSYNMLPYIREVAWKEGLPLSWEKFWEQAAPYSFVLESGRTGRYTYVGLAPRAILIGNNEEAVVKCREDSDPDAPSDPSYGDEHSRTSALSYVQAERLVGEPLDVLRRWMSQFRVPDARDRSFFVGGCIGYVGYDVARSLEKLPALAASDLDVPDYAFMLMDRVWVYDHVEEKLSVCIHMPISREMANRRGEASELREWYRQAARTADQMVSLWQRCMENGQEQGLKRRDEYARASSTDGLAIDLEQMDDLNVSMSKQQFTDAVVRVQDYIRAGDVQQVNLSVRQDRTVKVPPEIIYEWLRILNPSPYMGLLRLGDFQIVSASPELLLQKSGRRLRTRPIGGTRRRGQTEQEDLALEMELRANEKERAEHGMLVDLECDDIGRAAEQGSVKVEQFMVIERYSHVMHLVSDISGMLRDGLDACDALAAMFPGGTITGAPKLRTMEIIEELEPVRRSVYTGSFGWIDYHGNMEFNIIIRTLLAVNGRAYVQAGAGIVSDSEPVQEYRESLSKAKALWKAVQYAEQAEGNREFADPKEGA